MSSPAPEGAHAAPSSALGAELRALAERAVSACMLAGQVVEHLPDDDAHAIALLDALSELAHELETLAERMPADIAGSAGSA